MLKTTFDVYISEERFYNQIWKEIKPVSPGRFTGSRVAVPGRVDALFSRPRRHSRLGPKLRKMAHCGKLANCSEKRSDIIIGVIIIKLDSLNH